MPTRTFVRAAALTWLAAAIPAQEVAAPPAPPPSPRLLLHAECDGPAAWRTRFAPTNFGTMLASADGAKVWRRRLQPLDLWLREVLVVPGMPTDDPAARDRWLGYAGRVEYLVWTHAAAADEPPVSFGALRLFGDGKTDLDALGGDVQRLFAKAFGEYRAVNAAGRAWQVVPVGKAAATAPARVGDAIVVWFAENDAFATSEALAKDLPRPDGKGGALRLVVHGQDVQRHLQDIDPSIASTWRALGFGALTSAELAVGTAGPHVQLECAAHFAGDERGYFGAFFPPAAAAPPLLHLRPADDAPWKVGHFDVAALWRTSCAVTDAFRGHAAGTAHAAITKEWGVDPLADVFAQMHTDYMLVGLPGWSEDDGFVIDGCMVFRLRDEAKFAANFERMRVNWRPHIQKVSDEQHDGVTITHYSSLFVPLQMATARGLAFFAIGDNGADRIRAALDRAKGAPSAEPGADWTGVLRHVREVPNGIGQMDLHRVLTTQASVAIALLAFLPDGVVDPALPNELSLLVDEVLPLLDRYQLRMLRTATSHHDGRWSFRMFW